MTDCAVDGDSMPAEPRIVADFEQLQHEQAALAGAHRHMQPAYRPRRGARAGSSAHARKPQQLVIVHRHGGRTLCISGARKVTCSAVCGYSAGALFSIVWCIMWCGGTFFATLALVSFARSWFAIIPTILFLVGLSVLYCQVVHPLLVGDRTLVIGVRRWRITCVRPCARWLLCAWLCREPRGASRALLRAQARLNRAR